jgi:hypothetical protein
MSTGWIENVIDGHIAPQLDQLIQKTRRSLGRSVEHRRSSHWQPISTAPYNQKLELRIVERSESERAKDALSFPCRHLNSCEWVNTDLGVPVQINPIEWRVWQKTAP